MGDQVRTLEYKQAMSDFCNMFPGLDKNVIECVLRTNNGHVESTIDQLLQLTTENNETSSSRSSSTNKKDLRKLYYTLQSPSPTFEAPPMYSAVYSSPSLQQRDHKKSPSPRHDRHHNHRYKDWNPPLLGTLPTDFLRIKERPSSSSSSSSRKSSSCHHRTTDMVEVGGGELDERKISCLLKNEDFLKELRNNKAFMHEVKKLMKSDLAAAAAVQSNKPLEDVSFKDNLKHMSKYARSTFYDVARKFSSKKKSYKSMTSSNNNDDSNMYNDCHFN